MTRDGAGMTCEAALERILEADVEELSGDTSSPLAGHLERCERCRALADEVLDGQAALAAFLEGVRPRTGIGEALERVRGAVGAEDGRGAEDERGAGGRGARSGRRWRRAWSLVPLAAAAVVAGLLLVDRDGGGGPVVVTPSETRAPDAFRRRPLSAHTLGRLAGGSSAMPRPPRVAARSQAGVTLIPTSNPKVSVVWITPESD